MTLTLPPIMEGVPARLTAWPVATLTVDAIPVGPDDPRTRPCPVFSRPSGKFTVTAEQAAGPADPEAPWFWARLAWVEADAVIGDVDRELVVFTMTTAEELSLTGEPRRHRGEFAPTPEQLAKRDLMVDMTVCLALHDLRRTTAEHLDRGLAWLALLSTVPPESFVRGETFWEEAAAVVLRQADQMAPDWRAAWAHPRWASTPMAPVHAAALEWAWEASFPPAPERARRRP